jgi:hypothetical protein
VGEGGAPEEMTIVVALSDAMVVATLNRKDFENLGVELVEF